jgi:acetate kinase
VRGVRGDRAAVRSTALTVRVLAVNAGSSSLKLSVVDSSDAVIAQTSVGSDRDQVTALQEFAARNAGVDAVAHRLVHGGPSIRQATVVDDEVRRRLDEAISLAPLHVPPALRLLDAAREAIHLPAVICVDTAFHASMPDHATTYAVPHQWREWGVRRYGFHGLSYAWSSRRAATLLGRPVDGLQMVIAHIGAGVSACAIHGGRSVDTSMGLTPLEGAVMATRSGTVDPGALLWLQQEHGVSAAEVNRALEHDSGLLGLSGRADVRDVVSGAEAGDATCAAALDVYVHVLARVIGSLATSLQRLDALVFTGGVGEHSATVRARLAGRLALLGIPQKLAAADGDAVIARQDATPAVVVVTAREDAEMARETRALLDTPPR